MKKSDLNPKQQRFVEEYLVDLNGTQAAIRAGYSPETAESQASDLLRIPKVAAAVKDGQAARTSRTQADQDAVLKELMLGAYVDPTGAIGADGRLLPLVLMPEPVRRCIKSIRFDEDGRLVRVDFIDKVRCLELLAKHLGLFTEKVEVTGSFSFASLVLEAMQLARADRPKEPIEITVPAPITFPGEKNGPH